MVRNGDPPSPGRRFVLHVKGELAVRNERFTIAAVLTVAASIIPAMAAGQDFKIVVNAGNPTTTITKQNVSKCFLKQTTMWINGMPVIPVDQAANSEIREAFSQEVHDRDASSVRSFWQRQIFSGRGVPPTEKTSDEEVLAFVRINPGAVGYVSADANLGIGAKVLNIVDQ
jgi:hypothetical protein